MKVQKSKSKNSHLLAKRAGIAKQIAELIKTAKSQKNITIIARHHKELIEISSASL